MLASLNHLLGPAVMERLTLLVNHVLGAEPAATARLAPHAGRTIEIVLVDWPALLPPPPACRFQVTRAGLVEWMGAESGGGSTDLLLRVDASNPALLAARLLGGEQPTVDIGGDAQLASDVNWLMQNLRWDVAGDLDRLFGPLVAGQLHRVGRALAAAVHTAVQGLERLRSGFQRRP
jgi:ubiquinone biosynthesis accessory factor UbiJ